MPELFVEGEDETMEQIFDRVFSDLTKDMKDKLKREYITKEKIYEAPSRIRKICIDIIEHFTKNIQPNGFKAMIVAVSREAAVTYKRELDKLNGPMSKIIMTSKIGDRGRDGISWDEYYLSDDQIENVSTRFKSPKDPTQILIIVDMLLVGYDVPIVQVLYLDKALREHTLLQAIFRVNTPYTPEKQHGLIVDYCGITKQLQEALAIFDEHDIQDVLVPFDTEINELKLRHAETMSFFSDIKNKDDFDEIIVKFEPINVREDFEYTFKMFSKSLDAVMPRREADPFINDFKNLSRIIQRLRNVYGGVGLSLKIEGNKVQQLIDDVVRSLKISTLIEKREITDETFLVDIYKVAKTQKARTALVKNKARQIIDEKMHTNPAYYERMKERLENLIREERLRRKENANYFNYKEFLCELVETEKEIQKLGFTNTFEHAVYEELMRITASDKKISKDITKQIAEKIEGETKLVGWRNKRSTEKRLNILIYDIIFAEFQKRTKKNNNNFKGIDIEDLTKKIIELAKRDL